MDILKALKSYHYVIQLGGFKPAAEKLGLANSAITRHIQELEKQLNCTLMQRTTRTFKLTQEGEKLKKIAHSVLFQVQNLSADLANSSELKGELTFLVDPLLEQFVYEKCLGFQSLSDEIVIHQNTLYENFLLDIKPFDIALTTNKMVAAHKFSVDKSASHQFQLNWYAGTDYLQCEGLPSDIEALKAHSLIMVDHPLMHSALQALGVDHILQHAKVMHTNNIALAHQLLLDNKGVALMPEQLLVHDVQEHFAVELQHLATPKPFDMYVVRPKENIYSLLIDAIAAEFV